MEVKEILEKALAFYDDHDWIQGQSFSRANHVTAEVITGGCLEGACYWGAGHVGLNGLLYLPIAFKTRDADAALRDAAFELFPERFPFGRPAAVHKFNDHPLTTREDAILVLKHAIGKLDG